MNYIDGANLHQYTASNSTSFIDPWGLQTTNPTSMPIEKPNPELEDPNALYKPTQSMQEYWEDFLRKHPDLPDRLKRALRKQLYRGCIGVLCMNLARAGMPDLTNCYRTLKEAKDRAADGECCKGTDGPQVFSVQFRKEDLGEMHVGPDGRIDMQPWLNAVLPVLAEYGGGAWFNFGTLDGDQFVHARAGHLPDAGWHMEILRSTIDEWAKMIGPIDADTHYDAVAYCVECIRMNAAKEKSKDK